MRASDRSPWLSHFPKRLNITALRPELQLLDRVMGSPAAVQQNMEAASKTQSTAVGLLLLRSATIVINILIREMSAHVGGNCE